MWLRTPTDFWSFSSGPSANAGVRAGRAGRTCASEPAMDSSHGWMKKRLPVLSPKRHFYSTVSVSGCLKAGLSALVSARGFSGSLLLVAFPSRVSELFERCAQVALSERFVEQAQGGCY